MNPKGGGLVAYFVPQSKSSKTVMRSAAPTLMVALAVARTGEALVVARAGSAMMRADGSDAARQAWLAKQNKPAAATGWTRETAIPITPQKPEVPAVGSALAQTSTGNYQPSKVFELDAALGELRKQREALRDSIAKRQAEKGEFPAAPFVPCPRPLAPFNAHA